MPPRDEGRSIKVRCATWDQVEAFFAEKLKANTLVVKIPIQVEPGDPVTLALGLPNGLVFALDGRVEKTAKPDGAGKFPVLIKMHGLTDQVRERVARLVADGRAGLISQPTTLPEGAPGGAGEGDSVSGGAPVGEAPAGAAGEEGAASGGAPVGEAPAGAAGQEGEGSASGGAPVVDEVHAAPAAPRVEDVLGEERPVWDELHGVWERMRGQHAHDVLGVAADADLREVRRGYFALAKRFHPDVYGRYRSEALRLLAGELFVHVNKAYDRMRQAAIAAQGLRFPGPAMRADGWFASFDDVAEAAAAGEAMELVAEAPEAPAADDQDPWSAPPASGTLDGVADVLAFDSKRGRALDADELFGDMALGEAGGSAPRPGPAISGLTAVAAGREALEQARWSDARAHFAEALRADPKNRGVRALYHVASGMELRAKGAGAEAQLQFEAALIHDRECPEALRALGRLEDKKGLFKARRP